MKYSVDEVKDLTGNIIIRIKGKDTSFVAMENSISIYLDEKTASSIAWHINTIIEDRERNKKTSK
jgi:hypothetical protein